MREVGLSVKLVEVTDGRRQRELPVTVVVSDAAVSVSVRNSQGVVVGEVAVEFFDGKLRVLGYAECSDEPTLDEVLLKDALASQALCFD